MKFGPAEMAQMMDSAKALITVAIVAGVGIGIILGAIVAFYRIFFRIARPIISGTARPISNPECQPFLPYRAFLPGRLTRLRRIAFDHRSRAEITSSGWSTCSALLLF